MKEYSKAFLRLVLVTIAFCLNILISSAQDSVPYKLNLLTFEKQTIDLGTFSEDSGPKECVFRYRNNTDVPISIDRAIGSCDCTEVEYSKKPIPPGGTGEIKVIYSNDRGAQELNRRVTVYVSTTVKSTILRIVGEITAAEKISE